MSEGEDWKALMNMAIKLGIGGITLDGIKKTFSNDTKIKLFKDQKLQTTLMIRWFGIVNISSNVYMLNQKAIGKLAHFYRKRGLPMMLLKG